MYVFNFHCFKITYVENNLKVMEKLEEQQKHPYLLYSDSQPFNISLH